MTTPTPTATSAELQAAIERLKELAQAFDECGADEEMLWASQHGNDIAKTMLERQRDNANHIRTVLAALSQSSEAQRAVEAIKQCPELTKCQVIHMDYPAGWSCYDDFQQAQTSHGKYSPEFREKLAAGKGLCNQCRLRAIAASQLPRLT